MDLTVSCLPVYEFLHSAVSDSDLWFPNGTRRHDDSNVQLRIFVLLSRVAWRRQLGSLAAVVVASS
jgi:hypothetical protein